MFASGWAYSALPSICLTLCFSLCLSLSLSRFLYSGFCFWQPNSASKRHHVCWVCLHLSVFFVCCCLFAVRRTVGKQKGFTVPHCSWCWGELDTVKKKTVYCTCIQLSHTSFVIDLRELVCSEFVFFSTWWPSNLTTLQVTSDGWSCMWFFD